MGISREQTFSEYLGNKKTNKLFLKFVFTNDFKNVEAFAVSLISMVKEKPIEIIRFDCTKTEEVNVHRFYENPPTKHYLSKEKSFETLEAFIENIKQKWRIYNLQYKENYN